MNPRPHLTHVRADGSAAMVDVSDKDTTVRTAVATGQVRMQAATLRLLQAGRTPKGDVLAVARLAGIQGAKRTADMIPLCHPLQLSHVAVDLEFNRDLPGVDVRATVRTVGRTGVEMEALCAVACASLALYDMLKAVDRGMVIADMGLSMKDGGRSGRWEAPASSARRKRRS